MSPHVAFIYKRNQRATTQSYYSELQLVTYKETHNMVVDPKILTLSDYEELVQIKLNSSDFEIICLTESGLGERVGFMGEHYRIEIKIQRVRPNSYGSRPQPTTETQTLNFFAKLLPFGKQFRTFVEEMRGFEKESCFYTVISKDFGKFLNHTKIFPHCFMVKGDTLILEDMREYGFEPAPEVKKSANNGQCLQVLSALACFHSASIMIEETSQKSLTQLYPEIMFENVFVTHGRWGSWLDVGFKACEELLPLLPAYKNEPLVLSKIKEKFQGLKNKVLKILEPDTTARNVIGHGDAWLSNFLFQHKNENPSVAALIDFQALRYGLPALDIQLFLHVSLEYDKDRPYHMSKMEDFYYECLREELQRGNQDINMILPKNEFKQTCKYTALYGSFAACIYYQILQVDSAFIDKILSDQNLYEKYFLQDRTEELCTFFKTDLNFQKKMNNAMETLIKMIMDNNF